MYKASFMGKEKENGGNKFKRKIHIPVSIDNHLENGSNKAEDESANEYLNEVLGDMLGDVLSNCALVRPEDPVAFIADALER